MVFNKPYHHFESIPERDDFLKKYKLMSDNPKKAPVFYYKGRDVKEKTQCEIIGYEREYSDSATLVIDYGKGTCFIHSGFLKQMQNPGFDIDGEN